MAVFGTPELNIAMEAIELVIFDCDGVLIDSEIITAEAELEIYREYGFEMDAAEFAARFAGKSHEFRRAEIERELGHEFSEEALFRVKENVDSKCIENTRAVSGADTVLDLFDQARCVCSNSPRGKMTAMLDKAGLYQRFRPFVYSAEDFTPPAFKPKPDLIEKALGDFSFKPRQALVIEDSAHGIEAARVAGTRVIGFTGASHTYSGHADQLIDAGAETVISRFSDLPAILRAFSNWGGIA